MLEKENMEEEDEYPGNLPKCQICGKPATRLVIGCSAWICDNCHTGQR